MIVRRLEAPDRKKKIINDFILFTFFLKLSFKKRPSGITRSIAEFIFIALAMLTIRTDKYR